MNVVVFGLGYVGTVSATCLAMDGHVVVGVDLDHGKMEELARGHSPVPEPGLDTVVSQAVASGRLRSASSPDDGIAEADVALICVNTPLGLNGALSTENVEAAVTHITDLHRAHPRSKELIIGVRSTVPPGTMRSRLSPLVRDVPLVDIALCPEFMRETTAISDFYAPPYVVVGASSHRSAGVVFDLFSTVDAPHHFVSPETAAALKFASNAFHATKVSFANEVDRYCDSHGVDGHDVMKLLAADSALNTSDAYLTPGFAFGGSCLPKDLRGLITSADATGIRLPLLSGVLESNAVHSRRLADHVESEGWSTILIAGLAFKSGSSDFRGSPYLELARDLTERGIEVLVFDEALQPQDASSDDEISSEYVLIGLGDLANVNVDLAIVGSSSQAIAITLRQRGLPVLVAAESQAQWPRA